MNKRWTERQGKEGKRDGTGLEMKREDSCLFVTSH